MAKANPPAEVRGMNEHTYLNWVIQGTEGAINMLQTLSSSNVPVNPDQSRRVYEAASKLVTIAKALQERAE